LDTVEKRHVSNETDYARREGNAGDRLRVQPMTYVQLSFDDIADEFVPKVRVKPEKEKASFSDPAFASNKVLPIHQWVPWIAGFASEFVGQAIDRYVSGSGVVLDTFAGVGTTLVEALLRGKRGIGFEINPYAALAARVKVNAHSISPSALQEAIAAFYQFYKARVTNGYVPNSAPPPGFKGRAEFYSPKVLRKVLIIQDYIATLPEGELSDLFRVAFASTMVRYSNYSYEPSLGRRASAGKEDILDWPVAQTVLAKLQEMLEDITWLHSRLARDVPSGEVIQDSFFHYEQYLAPASVDLIVTSPPYLNNYHYNRNTRPQLYWLGYAHKPKDFNQLEQANFGKYWQTVRELERVELEDAVPGSDLAAKIEMLRGLNVEKGIYGGNGWANYAATYFNDCRKFARGIRYVLKPGSTALVVIGNSILQGVMLPTDKYFGEIAVAEGLEVVDIHIPRPTRVGNSIIQSDVRVEKAEDKHTLYEAVVELRRG
jgi:DNA methylase